MDYEKIVEWINNTHALIQYNHIFEAWEVILPASRRKDNPVVTVDDKCPDWLTAVNLAMIRY